jgi:hypothetical protein
MYCVAGVAKTRLAQVVYKNNTNAVYIHTRLTVKGVLKFARERRVIADRN